MIEINLLPHREARRAADLRQTAGVLALGLVLVVGSIVMIDSGIENDIARVEATVRQLEADIARYKPEEEQVQRFKAKRSELEDKLDVIKGLDRARSGPVRIMDELSKNTPDRLWLTGLSTQGVQITVEGDSLDTGVVADFLRSLNASPYFTEVDLERTSSGAQVEGVKRDATRIGALIYCLPGETLQDVTVPYEDLWLLVSLKSTGKEPGSPIRVEITNLDATISSQTYSGEILKGLLRRVRKQDELRAKIGRGSLVDLVTEAYEQVAAGSRP